MRRYQDGDVDDAVLFGSHELLSVENEHWCAAGILNTQLGHVALGRDLRYLDSTLGDRLLEVQRLYRRQRPIFQKDRRQGEIAVGARDPECDLVQ